MQQMAPSHFFSQQDIFQRWHPAAGSGENAGLRHPMLDFAGVDGHPAYSRPMLKSGSLSYSSQMTRAQAQRLRALTYGANDSMNSGEAQHLNAKYLEQMRGDQPYYGVKRGDRYFQQGATPYEANPRLKVVEVQPLGESQMFGSKLSHHAGMQDTEDIRPTPEPHQETQETKPA